MSARRLLGAHLPAASPERRETVGGSAWAVRRSSRSMFGCRCRRCFRTVGADVLASADIEGPETQRQSAIRRADLIEAPGTQRRLPFGAPRTRG